MSAIPSGISRDEWLAALPRAMVAGFVKTDKDFQEQGTNEALNLNHPVILKNIVVTSKQTCILSDIFTSYHTCAGF